MPSVTAKRQCPDLIFVKPRFEVYKAVSISEIFAEHTPVIEPVSLDEAYLDVTENLQNIRLARDVALAIRARSVLDRMLKAMNRGEPVRTNFYADFKMTDIDVFAKLTRKKGTPAKKPLTAKTFRKPLPKKKKSRP